MKHPEERISQILHWGYYHEEVDLVCELADGLHFVNHHDTEMNCALVMSKGGKSNDESIVEILKDIQPGEEILGNYAHDIKISKDAWVNKLYEKYEPTRDLCYSKKENL